MNISYQIEVPFFRGIQLENADFLFKVGGFKMLTGRGTKMAKKVLTYFMDGPILKFLLA